MYTIFAMKEVPRSDFARNLIALRKERGYSQRDLAAKSGISHRMLAYYETHSVIPPIQKLEALAKALDSPVVRLLDRTLTDKDMVRLNTRTMKKVKLMEQLPPEDQRKVLEYIQALLAQRRYKQQTETPS